jgi:hypothetical protein
MAGSDVAAAVGAVVEDVSDDPLELQPMNEPSEMTTNNDASERLSMEKSP